MTIVKKDTLQKSWFNIYMKKQSVIWMIISGFIDSPGKSCKFI